MADDRQLGAAKGEAKGDGIADEAVAKNLGYILAATRDAINRDGWRNLGSGVYQRPPDPPPRLTEQELIGMVKRMREVEQDSKPRTENDAYWIRMVTAARSMVTVGIAEGKSNDRSRLSIETPVELIATKLGAMIAADPESAAKISKVATFEDGRDLILLCPFWDSSYSMPELAPSWKISMEEHGCPSWNPRKRSPCSPM